MNLVAMIGNLTRDPELRTTQGGEVCCSFTIAVNRPKSKNGEEKADFFSVKVYRGQAEACNTYLRKGSKVAVNGSMETYSYTKKDGTKSNAFQIVARHVDFLGNRNSQQTEQYPQETASGYYGAQEVDDTDVPF